MTRVSMRRLSMALCVLLVACSAAPALAAETASPVFNGRFETFVRGSGWLGATPVGGEGLGVGHQIYCTQTAIVVWGANCAGAPADRVAAAQQVADHPVREYQAWTDRGYHDGDLGVLAPASANVWYAAGWNVYPLHGVAFGDFDGTGDREARFESPSSVLYQNYGATSTHMVVPMGTVQSISFRLEEGAPAGMVRLLLDSFPTESATDYPLFFYNYQLVLPAFAWQRSGSLVTIDPARGVLLGPSASSYAVADADDHPDASRWSSATDEERREILMQLRAIQLGFQSFDAGAVIDDVRLTLMVEDAPSEGDAESLSQAATS